MCLALFEKLHRDGLVGEASMEKIKQQYERPVLNVQPELRILLYLGVLLLTIGLSVLVYQYADRLGAYSLAIILLILTLGCYIYAAVKAPRFSPLCPPSPSVFFEYTVLLGALLLLLLTGYLQVRFQFFGNRWGLATFIPMILLFITAYYFDHIGVLCLSITNLAAWVGISMNNNTWYGVLELDDQPTILAGFSLGCFLAGMAFFIGKGAFKQHFAPVYHHFGSHLMFLSSISGILRFDQYYLLWAIALAAAVIYHLRKAKAERYFYYLVIACLYGYAGLSCIVTGKLLANLPAGNPQVYANLFYYVVSGLCLALIITTLNKKMHSNDRI